MTSRYDRRPEVAACRTATLPCWLSATVRQRRNALLVFPSGPPSESASSAWAKPQLPARNLMPEHEKATNSAGIDCCLLLIKCPSASAKRTLNSKPCYCWISVSLFRRRLTPPSGCQTKAMRRPTSQDLADRDVIWVRQFGRTSRGSFAAGWRSFSYCWRDEMLCCCS